MARTSSRARRTSQYFLPSAFDLFKPSKDLVLQHLWIFGPLYAVPFIFSIHAWIWAPLPNAPHHWWYDAGSFGWGADGTPLPLYSALVLIGFSLLWLLLILVGGTIVQIMSQRAQLDAAEGKEHITFERLWPTVKELGWRLAGLYIVSALAIVFTLFIFTRRYFLASYVMLDEKGSIGESMRRSAEISAKNPGSVLGVVGVILLIALVGAVPYLGGLASFILASFYSVAPALRYQQLKRLA